MENVVLVVVVSLVGERVREGGGGVRVFKNSPNLSSTCFNQDLRFEVLPLFKQFDFPTPNSYLYLTLTSQP